MSRRIAAVVAWGLFGFTVIASILWCFLSVLNHERGSVADWIAFSLLFASFTFVGALVASHHPGNTLGWLFLAVGLGATFGNLAQAYGKYALVTEPGSLPLGDWSDWLGTWMWPLAVEAILFILLLYPTGRLPSRRWSPVLWAAFLAMFFLNLEFVIGPGRLDLDPVLNVRNPAGIAGADPLLDVVGPIGAGLFLVVLLVAILSLIVRSRRSRGIERQQLKWFGYAALVMLLLNFVLSNVLIALFPRLEELGVGSLIFGIGLSLIPISTGIAISRYRLYEIDRLINRSLVYGVLTAFLAAAYLAMVVALQNVIPGADDSDLTIAASTLAVAALFRPLRARVQGFIDRRFYRRKYDAQLTLESFSSRLREDVDLDHLSRDLLGVVRDTMQPAHTSLWLKPTEVRR
jgi:hypothetical protein